MYHPGPQQTINYRPPPPKTILGQPDYKVIMANMDLLKQSFNLVCALMNEVRNGEDPRQMQDWFNYSWTAKSIYDRWEVEKRKLVLPDHADVNAPHISTIAGYSKDCGKGFSTTAPPYIPPNVFSNLKQ